MLEEILNAPVAPKPEPKPVENGKTPEQMVEELKAKRAALGATRPDQAIINGEIINVTKSGNVSRAKRKIGKRTQEEIDEANARKALVEKVSQDLVKIAKNINEPKPEDFQRIFEENAEDVIHDSVKYAIKIGAMTEEDARKFADFANVTIPKYVNKSGEGMNKAQEAGATDMENGFQKVFKDGKEYKISIKALSQWIKKIGIRLHLVETPEAKRVPIPFTLMGNKSATIRKIIKPAVINAIKNGSKNYVEPYGGAGTTLYIADDLFSAGLETMDLNFYDKEKYVVQNAVKNGEIDPVNDVEEAWDSVMIDIIDSIKDEPGMQELVEYLPEFGTPAFKEAASLIFYPTYATRYFKEVEDGKLAKGGELTTTFLEWLVEDVKKSDTTLTDEEAEQVAMEMLDEENFEANYPKISSQISEVIARIDNIDSIQGDARTALRVAIAKHLKQRGSSGQRILSASSGFTSVAGARDKMIKGLSFYKEVYDRHGDKITIHNADGKEFVSDMAGKYDAKNVVMYADPPYIRTTKVYVGNRGVEELGNLVEYGDPKKYKEIFAPMKDATAIFTNDVNGEYFNSLQELYGDRLSKDVLAYREGTTPTSMVTTVETKVTPRAMGLPYYRINKARKIKEAIRNLEETVFPKISKALQKQISKMIVAIEKSADATRMKLINEIKKQENAVIQFEQLQSLVELLVTGKEKQNILTKAKKLVRSGTISGPKMLDMFQYINKAWEDRLDMVKQVRDESNDFLGDENADVRGKKEFEEEFAGYAFRPFTNQQKADIALLEAINSGEYTPEQSQEYIERMVNGTMVETETGEKVNKTEKEYLD